MIDVLDYMCTPQPFSLYNHLTSQQNPVYFQMGVGQLWYIKGALGYPWDMYTFDQNWVYAGLTEFDWNNPKTFKRFTRPLVWAPRMFNPLLPTIPTVTDSVTFEIHTDCNVFTTQPLGQVTTHLLGPYRLSLGGDLPPGLDVVSIQYQWNSGQTMEIHIYARGYGMVQWTSLALIDGFYKQTAQSTFNKISVGGSPQVDFPCQL